MDLDDTRERYDPTTPLRGGLRALEASAGTGKTFAITSTVLRLVVERAEPFEMDRLLLVTFTRAATAELEDRVRRRLVEGHRALVVAEDHDDWTSRDDVLVRVVDHARRHGLTDARRRVEEALRTVDQATVTTIHGFCHQVLQQAAVHADSDPGVVIDTDDDRLVTAVVDDWLVRFTHDADPALIELLGELRLGRATLHRIGRTVAGEPAPSFAPDVEAPDDLDPLAEIEDSTAALRRALEVPDDQLDTVAAAHGLMALSKDEGGINGNSTWAPTERRMLGRLRSLREAAASGRLDGDVLASMDPGAGHSSAMPPEIVATSVPRAIEAVADTRARVETAIRRRFAQDVRAELHRRREEAGTASFADLLRQLAAALDEEGGDQLVAAVGGQFDAVLVDEFQDTDPVQWSILHRLFADAELFHVVGDPKQAIYGWRGADLRTYLDALDDAEAVTTMGTNWRSDPAYVAACNHLLDEQGSLGGAGVEYVAVAPAHDADRLLDAAGHPAAGLVLTYLPGIEDLRAATVRDRVAQDVAQDIVDTLHRGPTVPADGGGRRDVVAGDCAVLVRRHTEAAAVAEALRARDVPVVTGGGDDVLRSVEADDVADLLRVLTSPGDDRALRRLLVGPFVGLDGGELDAIDEDRWQQHAVDVRRWAQTWSSHGIAAAVQRAIREGEAERRHAGRRDGDRTMTNIRHLTELLHLAEQEEALGTHALASWFDARRAEAEEETTPPERELRLERDDAAVKVMTVHAAKGREFPLVWVPFLWTREGRGVDGVDPFVVNDPAQEYRRTVALHAASSKAVREADPERRRLREAYERAEWEGGLRLAYVALTRAEHRCTIHLCGYDWQGSLAASPAWQLLWRSLGSGAPGEPAVVPDEQAMRDALHGLAEHPHVSLVEHHDERPATSLTADGRPHGSRLTALTYDRDEPLDVRWGRASFTGLLRARAAPAPEEADAEDEADLDQAADRHATSLEPLPRERWNALPQVPLADLPRGASWGTFLHDVLEHVDFDASTDELRVLVDDRARHATVDASVEHLDVVTGGLAAALVSPLGGDLGAVSLSDVGRGHRLDELEFTLTLGDDAASSVTVGAIADVFDRHAAASDAPLAAAARHLRAGGSGVPAHGLLIGSIDLVLRHDGRFWIADYKSNGLGQWLDPAEGEDGEDGEDGGGRRRWIETEAHTGPDRVMTAMLHGDYLLQAHLYLVALERYLRSRLGESYDYERHVGGWAYLFLRGMTGEDVAHADGRPHGVATGRPTHDLIAELDAVLRGEGAAS